MKSSRVRHIYIVSLLLFIALFSLFALTVGSARVDSVWKAIFDPSYAGIGHQIVWDIRFPRIAAALLIGGALGVAGALAQAATNNPLADPSIIGTSAGAALGATVAVIFNLASVASVGATLAATCGALLASLITFSLARSALQLLIVGIAISALLSAISGLMISIADKPEARSISFWSVGSLSLVTPQTLIVIAPGILTSLVVIWFYARKLDLFALGDREIRHLGLKPERMRFAAFVAISFLIAISVSSVGSIAFLSLAAPHIARSVSGPRTQPLILGSALTGGALLLFADTTARALVPPLELPIGLITSAIGAPILIFLIRRTAQVWR